EESFLRPFPKMGCAKKVCQTLIARYLRDTRKSPERATSRRAAIAVVREGPDQIWRPSFHRGRCDRGTGRAPGKLQKTSGNHPDRHSELCADISRSILPQHTTRPQPHS